MVTQLSSPFTNYSGAFSKLPKSSLTNITPSASSMSKKSNQNPFISRTSSPYTSARRTSSSKTKGNISTTTATAQSYSIAAPLNQKFLTSNPLYFGVTPTTIYNTPFYAKGGFNSPLIQPSIIPPTNLGYSSYKDKGYYQKPNVGRNPMLPSKNPIIKGLGELYDNVKAGVGEIWNDVTTGIGTGIDNVTSPSAETFNEGVENVTDLGLVVVAGLGILLLMDRKR